MPNDTNGQSSTLASFIWRNADDLWGDFKHTDFGKIILPFTLLRRLECVLEPTREQALETVADLADQDIDLGVVLRQITGYPFYNTSNYTLGTLGATRTRQNLEDYIAKFSDNARVIFEQFDFANTIARMDKQGVLYRICQNFADTDLHPDAVPERVMSNIYEHLIRRFGAEVNEAVAVAPELATRVGPRATFYPLDGDDLMGTLHAMDARCAATPNKRLEQVDRLFCKGLLRHWQEFIRAMNRNSASAGTEISASEAKAFLISRGVRGGV